MDKWWQDPRLDDEGTYDYLIEPLPENYARWELTKEAWKCDDCGKERHLMLYSAHHFYCWDGWDSMNHQSCWKCMLKSKLHNIKHKIKRKYKIIRATFELWHATNKKMNLKHCHQLACKIER